MLFSVLTRNQLRSEIRRRPSGRWANVHALQQSGSTMIQYLHFRPDLLTIQPMNLECGFGVAKNPASALTTN